MRGIILIGSKDPVTAAGTLVPLAHPDGLVDWTHMDEVTFILSVRSVAGSPTAWSLNAKFQILNPHTGGYQYTTPEFFDLSAENEAVCIVEGVGFQGAGKTAPLVADESDTLPVTVMRSIRHFGSMVQVVLTPSFTGGTSPGLVLSLVAIPKGR